jgi:hypothetical protein
MHEIVSRAKLRGRPDAEIFNTRNCIQLTRDEHEAVTHNRMWIDVGEQGADGCAYFWAGSAKQGKRDQLLGCSDVSANATNRATVEQ